MKQKQPPSGGLVRDFLTLLLHSGFEWHLFSQTGGRCNKYICIMFVFLVVVVVEELIIKPDLSDVATCFLPTAAQVSPRGSRCCRECLPPHGPCGGSSETQTVRCVWSRIDVTSLTVRVAMAACGWSD